MSGFAKGGVAIIDGGNLAIAGNKPAGIAVQGNVIYHGGVTWTLLAKASFYAATPPVTSSAIDTTGVNLLVIHEIYYSGNAVVTPTDSMNNVWIQAVDYFTAAMPSTKIYYCINPKTSTTHTFTAPQGNTVSCQVLGFKGPTSIILDKVASGLFNSSSITNSPGSLIPTANENLLITGVGVASQVLSVDSGFSIEGNIAYVGYVTYSNAIAALTQEIAAAITPTWTFNAASTSVATMLDFIPSPWTLLAHTAAFSQNSTTAPINTTGATLICIVLTVYGSTNISDSQNNTWINVTAIGGVNNTNSFLFYCLNPITSPSHTFSFNAGQNYCSMYVTVFKSTEVAIFDTANGVAGPSDASTVVTSASITPTVNNNLIIAGIATNSTSAQFSVGNGFAITDQGGNEAGAAAFLLQGAKAAIAPVWTLTYGNINYGSATSIASFVPVSVTTGLTDFWPMNEGAGTTFNNAVNPSNPMTASNITWATNTGFVNAPSPQFNGTNSGAVSAQNSTLNGPFSLCVAVIMTAASQTVEVLCSYVPISTKGWLLQLSTARDIAAYIIYNYPAPSSYIYVNSTGNLITLNVAHYICFTYDGSGKAAGVKIYVDGTLASSFIGQDSFSGSFLSNTPVYAGQAEDGSQNFNGTLANARIYNRVLTAAEVSALASTMGK